MQLSLYFVHVAEAPRALPLLREWWWWQSGCEIETSGSVVFALVPAPMGPEKLCFYFLPPNALPLPLNSPKRGRGELISSSARPLDAPQDLDPAPPPRPASEMEMGNGATALKSNKRLEYPLADEYTLDGSTPLDETEVEHLTNAIRGASRKRRHLMGPAKSDFKLLPARCAPVFDDPSR